MNEQVDLLGRLTQVVATTPDLPLPQRLCLAFTTIFGFDSAGLTIGYSAPTRTTLAATDAAAERLEEAQDLVREGPSLEAHRLRRVVDVQGTDLERRWPMLAQSLADDLAPSRVVAAPMRPASEVLGVITLHGPRGGSATVDHDQVQFLANAVGVAVLGGFERAEGTDALWSARDRVNQATGMVVAQLRIHPADALALLRAHAFAHDTSLAAIAADVVRRDLIFDPRPATGPTTTDEADD